MLNHRRFNRIWLLMSLNCSCLLHGRFLAPYLQSGERLRHSMNYRREISEHETMKAVSTLHISILTHLNTAPGGTNRKHWFLFNSWIIFFKSNVVPLGGNTDSFLVQFNQRLMAVSVQKSNIFTIQQQELQQYSSIILFVIYL